MLCCVDSKGLTLFSVEPLMWWRNSSYLKKDFLNLIENLLVQSDFLEEYARDKGGNMMRFTVTGHELNTVHDMKKVTLLLTQATLDELHKEENKKI